MRAHATRPWSRPIAAAAFAVAAVTGIGACSSSAPASSPSSPTSSPASPASSGTSPASSSTPAANGQHLAASDFATALRKPGTIVLDVRTPTEFATGHLPDAQNIDMQGSGFATRIATLDKKATYAVYCRSGMRSGVALKQMEAAGFTHVYDLAGGIMAWQSMGGPMIGH